MPRNSDLIGMECGLATGLLKAWVARFSRKNDDSGSG